MLLAIDPGTDTGWALFNLGKLNACGLGDPRKESWAPLARVVFVEVPRIYPGGRTKNPQDVLKLAVKVGEFGGHFAKTAEVHYVEPARWKGGQVKKDIQHARDWARLLPDEQALLSNAGKGIAPSKRHNMLDAVGIGLYACGRGAAR